MKHNFEDCYQEATTMFANGYDSKYIGFQLAEKGVPDEMIDDVLIAIKKLRKGVKRSVGMKQVIYGSSFILVAIGFTFLSTNENSPITYILWGLAVTGVLTLIKGIANIIGLL